MYKHTREIRHISRCCTQTEVEKGGRKKWVQKGKVSTAQTGGKEKWHLGTISVKLYIKFEKKKKKETWGSSFHY